MLGRVAWQAVAGAASTIAWTLAPRRAEPGLALLEGEPFAIAGVPATYRMRLYNPTAGSHHLTVLVRGWREEEPDPAFELRWDIALGPWASAERWVSSNWRGDASLVTGPLPERPVVWAARPAGRWRVEARIGGGDRDALHIAGTFVA